MRGRASTTPDIRRVAEAIGYPGIDPRTWVSLAIVEAVEMDATDGPLADCLLLPSQDRATARIGAAYAGSGFGLWATPRVDDEVLVAAPSGDPDAGLVIIARLWSPADPPAAEMTQAPADVLLRVESGNRLKLVVAGGGEVLIEAEGTGDVKLLTSIGDVEAESSYGSVHAKTALGDIVLDPAGVVYLGSTTLLPPLDGVVHGTGLDPLTGVPYALLGSACLRVLARKA